MTTRSLILSLAPLLTAAPALAQTGGDPPEKDKPVIALAEATKGLTGAGPLMAKIEIDHGGKAMGTFTCELFDKQSPKTVANFVGLARGLRPFKDQSGKWGKKPFYDGLVFHRVISGFMIQGGDPKG